MQCPTRTNAGGYADDFVISFAAGRLSPEDEIAFSRHIEICQVCRDRVDSQTELWSTLDAWQPVPVSPDFDRRLYARIAAEEQRPWYRKVSVLSWSRPAMPVAAACAALLIALLLRTPTAVPNAPQLQAVNHSVDIEQVERALDDVDMLRQLGVVAPAPVGVPQEPM